MSQESAPHTEEMSDPNEGLLGGRLNLRNVRCLGAYLLGRVLVPLNLFNGPGVSPIKYPTVLLGVETAMAYPSLIAAFSDVPVAVIRARLNLLATG